ncbi:hypothetical protein PCANC_19348 [Puccinia coronata f. sp. avenae]|uniref:Uncharacterized protein n=1 Tax=Puccinia coronata f. sp. avenae TaxID=200324 RepID=A0A2N5SDK8_9BASI|nr:hypothetical protein PCANC_19348 [Puccinia coronata f. sp. avenae]
MYQPGKDVDLRTKLVAVPAGKEVDTSSMSRSISSPDWYRDQIGEQVSQLGRLVPVPAQGVGQPTRWTGKGTSLASSSAYSLSGYLYPVIGGVVDTSMTAL